MGDDDQKRAPRCARNDSASARRRLRAIETMALTIALSLGVGASAFAQNVLIRNATVHTAGAQGTLQNTDVLVRNGTIAAIGKNLSANGVETVDAEGKPLTPALFGGINSIGLQEISLGDDTRDQSLALGGDKQMVVRREFDVTLAYNPMSMLIPVARVEGVGFSMLGAGSVNGGSIVGGQGGIVRLDGSPDPIGPRALFLELGSDGADLTGKSRAAQWMLLDQLIDEVRGRIGADSGMALLTPAGRQTLTRYLDGGGRVVARIHRAADIRQLLRWSQRHNVRIAILGGAEAWMLGPQLAAAKVPVFVDPLANLPGNFDQIGATLENAARLRAAGVQVGFSQFDDASHYARKLRYAAGNAVANGLPWEDGLAGLTRVPAETFGVGDRIGTIAVGKRADLVLWNGDPLEVSTVAQRVWFDGNAIPMRSRQTELRDRYLRAAGDLPRAYPPGGE
ncbi:MAG: amidohydrolase family protein [Xanthomonadaceae bacterium]|nr:amidohydrolase family protein [Xanthomonadaceae bacterium]